MPKSDHFMPNEIELTINGTHYTIEFERTWTRVNEEQAWQGERRYSVDDDKASDIHVNDIPLGYFVPGFYDQVRHAIDNWMEHNEPIAADTRY